MPNRAHAHARALSKKLAAEGWVRAIAEKPWTKPHLTGVDYNSQIRFLQHWSPPWEVTIRNWAFERHVARHERRAWMTRAVDDHEFRSVLLALALADADPDHLREFL